MKPLRNLVQVERIVETQTSGGIHIPQTFKSRGPAGRLNAKGDYFRARVLAVGPDVREGELSPGDEVLVFTYADGDGSRLYTGESAQGTLFVTYPDDILAAVEPEAVVDGRAPVGDWTTKVGHGRQVWPHAIAQREQEQATEAAAIAEADPFPEGHPYR